MKKVIESKLYNTDTATLVSEYDSGPNRSDFTWWQEKLFITNKNNWFIFGEGGPASHYAQHGQNESWGSWDIRRVAEHEAYEWLESHNDIEAINLYFPGEIEEA